MPCTITIQSVHEVNEHKIDCIIWSIILPVVTHMHYASLEQLEINI